MVSPASQKPWFQTAQGYPRKLLRASERRMPEVALARRERAMRVEAFGWRVEIAANNGHIRAFPPHSSSQIFGSMTLLTFEDFTPGNFGTFGPRHVTREEILAFAAEYDPQPMHLDEAAANASMLKGLSGS